MRRRQIDATSLSAVLGLSVLLNGCGGGGSTSPLQTPNGAADNLRTIQSEMPRAAGAFVDSIGVNIHLGGYGTAYVNDFPAVISLLTDLGVHHVRDGVALNQPVLCNEDLQLASHGIHFDFITAPGQTTADLAAWSSCVGSAAESLEGPNEYDNSHPSSDGNWTATLSTFQKALYADVKATSQMTVIGPAMMTQSGYAALGDLSAFVDDGNVHDYFAGRNPGTGGWGGTDSFGTYGSLAWNLAIARQLTGAKPIYATETGYADAPGAQYAVPAATKARYTLRTLLENWNAGIVLTYVYELIDESNGSFGSYGITDSAANPKPAYVAMKNMIAHLADPGAPVSTQPLNYSLTVPSSLHHALLERHDGSYALVLWVEAPDWNVDAQSALAVARQNATLSFAAAPRTVTVTTFDDGGNVTTSPLTAAKTLVVSAGPNPTIVDITP
jgi:hypothetical protein